MKFWFGKKAKKGTPEAEREVDCTDAVNAVFAKDLDEALYATGQDTIADQEDEVQTAGEGQPTSYRVYVAGGKVAHITRVRKYSSTALCGLKPTTGWYGLFQDVEHEVAAEMPTCKRCVVRK